jgi:hemerythrin-like domain-containing protein
MTLRRHRVERSVMSDILVPGMDRNVHGMVVVHRAFRRESHLLGELIAAVPDGDTERAAVLARHLTWYEAGLTNHHGGEDELLWPLLYNRAGVDTEIVTRMERQHAQVAETLAGAMKALPAWQASAGAARRDLLVNAISCHRRVMIEHLDDEESHLLPLAARHLTDPEWEAVGEHFVATTPKAQLLIFLGAVLEDATPEERATMLNAMPWVARIVWRSVGRRRYASHMRRVRGNAARDDHPQSTTTLMEV